MNDILLAAKYLAIQDGAAKSTHDDVSNAYLDTLMKKIKDN